MEESDVVVVFEGLKYFENYQKKLDVSIINHTEFLCLEVIVFGNGRGSKRNISRMYVDAELLLTKIDLRMFNDTLFIRQNSMRRLKQTVESSTLNKSISMNMMVNILISRLLIYDANNSGSYEIYFQHYENDYGELKYREDGAVYAELDFQFDSAPDGLVPYSPLESRSSR
jgi:type II secretory ATPase GspE/PulE/Tfp pilus assembly ATPase PilB-like protein